MHLVRFIQVFTFCSSSITFLINKVFKIVDQKHWLLLHIWLLLLHIWLIGYGLTGLKEKGKSLLTRISWLFSINKTFFVLMLFCLIWQFLNVCTIFFIIKEILEDAGKGKE